MKYNMTTKSIAVHPDSENPVFGRYVTIVSLDDEGDGAFITLQQTNHETGSDNTMRIDFNEFDVVSDAIRLLRVTAKNTKGFE